jgi:hypothetical protein
VRVPYQDICVDRIYLAFTGETPRAEAVDETKTVGGHDP